MQALKKIGTGLGILIVGILVMGLFLAEEFAIERSIVINAPAEKVFTQVNDLRNWSNWSPWHKLDPNMKITFSDNTAGLNAWYSWDSKDENVGQGKLSIIESQTNQVMKTKIEFPGFPVSYGSWKLEPEGNGTKVTWGFSGTAGDYWGRYFGAMMDMMMGSTFEQGLQDLKKVSEREA